MHFSFQHGNAMEQQESQRAMSKQTPSVDLLIPSANYQCQNCMFPLANSTRIVAKQRSSEGFSNFCIACLAGWSKLPYDSELAHDYQYYVMPSFAEKLIEDSQWTNLEICALFQCVQKYGIDSWGLTQKQFVRRTGVKRLETELAQKYFELNQGSIDLFNYKRQNGFGITDEKPNKKPMSNAMNIDKLSTEDQAYAWQFYQMLKNTSILQISGSAADNFSDYLFKLLFEEYNSSGQINRISPKSSELLAFASKWMENSHTQQSQTSQIHKSLCKIYVNMRKRECRKKRQLLPPAQQTPKDYNTFINHPELGKLKNMPDMAQLVEQVAKLRQKRQTLKSNLRAKKIHQREQENQVRKERVRVTRASRNAERQRQRLAQTLQLELQDESPRRITRSFQDS